MVAAMNKIYSDETVEVKNAFCSKFVNFRCFQFTHLIVVALITPEQNCSIVAFFFTKLFNHVRFDFVFYLRFDFVFSLVISSLKGRQTPLSNSDSTNVTKKMTDFYHRKWNLIIRFPTKIKILSIN